MANKENILNFICDNILVLIDLIFDKHCEMKEYARDYERLECDNILAMKEELKSVVTEVLRDE